MYGNNLSMQPVADVEGGIISKEAGFEIYRPVQMLDEDSDDSDLNELREQLHTTKHGASTDADQQVSPTLTPSQFPSSPQKPASKGSSWLQTRGWTEAIPRTGP